MLSYRTTDIAGKSKNSNRPRPVLCTLVPGFNPTGGLMRINRVFTLASAALSGLIFTGCAQESAPPVTASRSQLANDTAVTASATESAAMPDSVSAAFHRDFKDAGVTRVTPATTEIGQPFYRITFISSDGVP